MPGKHGKVEDRFWAKVDRSGGPEACWLWTGGTFDERGYGAFQISKGKTARAHRLAWKLTHGDPGDRMVLHECDNPPCCNPNKGHLYLGDHAQNMRDKALRKRGPRGPGHHKSKLTTEQVVELRIRYAKGEGTMESLGAEYGICKASAKDIIRLHHRVDA